MSIRLLLLDADGVVQRAGASAFTSLQALVAPADRDRFIADVFAAELPCLAGQADFLEALEPLVARWHLALSPAQLLAFWRDIVVDDAVLALVQALRAGGLACALATNQQRYRAQHMVDVLRLGAHFDALYFSCDLGVAKPHVDYFKTIRQRCGVPPQHTLFIDDSAANVHAARDCGLCAEHFPANGGVDALRPLLAMHAIET